MSANEILPDEINVLIDAMKSIGGGELTRQAAANLSKAVKATCLEDKKSSVIIELTISKSNDEMITIAGSTRAKLPTHQISGAFFVNHQTYLPQRDRPNQMVMNFTKQGE